MTTNNEIYTERFFTFYKLFWSMVYFMLAYAGIAIAQDLGRVVLGIDIYNPPVRDVRDR